MTHRSGANDDGIPDDATIYAVRAIPVTVENPDDGAEMFDPGHLYVWANGCGITGVTIDGTLSATAVAMSDDAADQYAKQDWPQDIRLYVRFEDADPVDPGLDACIRALVALTGKMPIDTANLLIDLSNEEDDDAVY